MSARVRVVGRLAALAVLGLSGLIGCLQQTDPADGEQLEVDCRGAVCPWEVKTPDTAKVGTTWLEGDQGVDLSGTGAAVIEQRVVMLQQTSRTLDLRAGVVHDGGTLRVELDWYAAGPGVGKTFWDRDPKLLVRQSYEIWETGASQVRRTILVPSEGVAFVLRLAKDSTAPATVMVGDLTIGHPAGSSL
jgi:hypothetical protein